LVAMAYDNDELDMLKDVCWKVCSKMIFHSSRWWMAYGPRWLENHQRWSDDPLREMCDEVCKSQTWQCGGRNKVDNTTIQKFREHHLRYRWYCQEQLPLPKCDGHTSAKSLTCFIYIVSDRRR
jgi:hypothetical protein